MSRTTKSKPLSRLKRGAYFSNAAIYDRDEEKRESRATVIYADSDVPRTWELPTPTKINSVHADKDGAFLSCGNSYLMTVIDWD